MEIVSLPRGKLDCFLVPIKQLLCLFFRFCSHFPAISPQGAGRMPFLQSGLCEIARHLISCIGINPGDSALSPIPADLTSTQPGTSYLCQATSKFRSRHTLSGTRYLNTNNFYLTLNPSLITLAVYKTKVFKIKTSCSTEKKAIPDLKSQQKVHTKNTRGGIIILLCLYS